MCSDQEVVTEVKQYTKKNILQQNTETRHFGNVLWNNEYKCEIVTEKQKMKTELRKLLDKIFLQSSLKIGNQVFLKRMEVVVDTLNTYIFNLVIEAFVFV